MRATRLLTALVVLLAPAVPAFAQEFSVALGPNPSCGGTMRPITALEAFEHKDEICKRLGLDQEWGIWGIAGGGAMGGPGYGCNIMKKWPPGPINGPTICTARTATGARTFAAQALSFDGAVDLAVRFAPVLKFDRAASNYGFPMKPQQFFDALKKENGVPVSMPGNASMGIENKDRATLADRSIPTYYQVRTAGNQVRIRYWWFYGYQHACYRNDGAHNGDWENIIVILNEARNAVAAVVYYQHGGWYTRIAGPRDAPCTPGGTGRCGFSGFRTDGERPVVYVGKISHGSFHDDNASGAAGLQAPNPGEGDFTNCSYYGDYRNPASPADWLHTQDNLVDLDLNSEPWMDACKGIIGIAIILPCRGQMPVCRGGAAPSTTTRASGMRPNAAPSYRHSSVPAAHTT